jgi:hypothetical protein
VGFVWRLLAGEAVRGEGRWYGCMMAGLLQVREVRGWDGRAGGRAGVLCWIIVAAETGEC